MTNDPTTTPDGEADMSLTGSRTGRSRVTGDRSRASYPGMMGDGTEEQNLGQVGDPSARIGQDEVQQAFAASVPREPRSFLDKEAAMDVAEKAKDAAADKLSALTDKVNAMRDQVQQSAEAARDWAAKQAGSAKDAARQLHTEKPVLVLSVSAGAALAVGLLAGFVIGRATADEY
jgi:ElaB/YqjD/DUF883 family membrane-anchored ribosome-binding protein